METNGGNAIVRVREGEVSQANSIATPFVPQPGSPESGRCGAAALAMALARLGRSVSADEVWPEISRYGRRGVNARTHLLARAAIQRGLHATVIQLRDPWPALGQLHRAGLSLILNHRLAADSTVGHFSVLVDWAEDAVWLHDPIAGPNRQVQREALLSLWRPLGPSATIAGSVVVAIGADPGPRGCGACDQIWPDETPCPGCGNSLPLTPMAAIGCLAHDCGVRSWSTLFCPTCDEGLEPRRDLAASRLMKGTH